MRLNDKIIILPPQPAKAVFPLLAGRGNSSTLLVSAFKYEIIVLIAAAARLYRLVLYLDS